MIETPSFAEKVASRMKCRCRAINSKLGAYVFLDSLGISHAHVFGVVHGLDLLEPSHLAKPVVLKPLKADSAIGVMKLRPTEDGWLDEISDRHHSFESIVARQREWVLARGYPDIWMLEEPLEPPTDAEHPLVDDCKVYVFGGEPQLILMRREYSQPRRRTTYRWYYPDWTPDPDVGRHSDLLDSSLGPPADRDRVLDLARKIGEAVPLPFIRVDTISTDRGVLVGEINNHVGKPHKFSPEWGRYLGQLWQDAELDPSLHTCLPIPESVMDGKYPAQLG